MTHTILIVEDDVELQELYAAMLEGRAYRLVQVYDGGEALESLRETRPDLIILDILLDEMMGDDFFLQLKQEPGCADIPVVIASVLPAESCGNLLELDPAIVYLQKPFRKHMLLETLDKNLGKQG